MDWAKFETPDGWQWAMRADPAAAEARLAVLVGVDVETMAYRPLAGGDELRPLSDFRGGEFSLRS